MPKEIEGRSDDAGEGGGGDDISRVVNADIDAAEANKGGPKGGEPADPGVFGSVDKPGEHEGHGKTCGAVPRGETGVTVRDDIEGFAEPAVGAAREPTGPGEGGCEV